MQHFKAGSRPTKKATSDYFTGTVWQDPIVEAPEPARIRGLRVTFEPGSRTAWHSHPLGQTLVVVSGVGRFQTDGEPVVEIKPGDVIWIPPHERHWRGAAPDTMMSHLAFQESLDGTHASWMEHVSDEDYLRAPGT
jgi:quercetin dioxygenase-like cupin family protein